MIQVPLDKIIPIEEALLDIGKIMDTVKAQRSLYVITKEGKPHSAIIDIDMLEHLPEMNTGTATRPIHEIGVNDNSYEGISIENNSPISQGANTPQPQIVTESPEFTQPQANPIAQKAQEEIKDTLSEDIGPWSDTTADGKGPQDLDI